LETPNKLEEPNTGNVENYYQTKYQARQAYNEANGVTTLKDVRSQLLKEFVSPYILSRWGKGSIESHVPRSAIVSQIMAIVAGANLDDQFMEQHAGEIRAAGLTPMEALARFHKSLDYKQPLANALDSVFEQRPEFVENIIDQYVASQTPIIAARIQAQNHP
jgi:hypothetical protein